MKRNLFTLIVSALLVVLFGLVLVMFQVRKTEVAIVTTFGKPTRPITEAGRHWKPPWPIQRVYKFDNRVQNFESPLRAGLTPDGFNLMTAAYVGWKITDPEKFFPKFAGSSDPVREAEKGLGSLLENTESGIIGKHPLSDFISATDGGKRLDKIEAEILSELRNQVAAQQYGLSIEFLGLKKLEFPENVTETVFKKMQSERATMADRLKWEGDKEAQRIRSEAEVVAAETRSRAELEAKQLLGKAEVEAAKSLAILQRDPELANILAGLGTLESALKSKTTLIFDPRTRPFELFQYGGLTTNSVNK